MKLVIIFGPPAVGKMTVAQELSKITDCKVFHNHMSIDVFTKIFQHGSEPFRRLNRLMRDAVMEEAAKTGVNLLFTYVWALDQVSDKEEIDHYKRIVEKYGGQVYFVELEADQRIRLERNKTENRLRHKDKANIEKTEANLIDSDKKYRLNSPSGEFPYPERYIKIDNSNLAPEKVADMVKLKFSL